MMPIYLIIICVMQLVYIEERGKLNIMADYDERTIWTSDQVPLMASYNKGFTLHCRVLFKELFSS